MGICHIHGHASSARVMQQQILNHLLPVAPIWSQHENEVELAGLRMPALVTWPMGTFYGFGFFLDPQVNAILREILTVWGNFLRSSTSADVLDGLFGPTAF